ncbi:MAG: ABC transporter transmembrane domain-containing protein [Devosia sp.]
MATDTSPRAVSAPPRLGRKGEAARVDPRSLRPLARLLPYVWRYKWRVLATIAFLLIAALTSLLIPLLAGRVVDFGFVAKNLDMVSTYGWAIVGIAAIMAVASAARFYFVAVLGERVILDLRRGVFDHLLRLDQSYFDLHRVGELTSRLNADVTTIRSAVGSSLSMTLRGLITIIGAVVLMFLTSWFLALAVVVVVPLIVVPVLLLSRRLRKMSRRTQDALAEMSAMATETLSAGRTVKSFVQEPTQSRLYGDRALGSYRAEVTRIGGRAALVGGIMFIVATALVVLVWWGAKSVFDGAVTTGQLTQFMLYALMATNALTSISEVLGSLQTVAGSTERLVEILDTPAAIVSPAQPVAMPSPPLGTVAFEHVGFAYETRDDAPILSDLSFTVARGETVALVGPSGAGKSTVFALLQRFYDINSGRILVDGVDLRAVDLAELRRHFAYVEQEPTMFAGTVADNIRFGRPEATDAEVERAARDALVHDFTIALPNGYASVVGERGVMLSGGQKQRVAIARALLKDAPILLLDEATSALDAESERVVQIALERLMQGRTTLVIAHRLATIRDADRILVLDQGRLIDQGTHEELVRRGGRYAELARLQFRYEPMAAE